MKKTIRINISGLIFNIDEDAYEKLQQYLGSITKKFINTEEGNEIIADVEARIAELFHERIGDRKEVVNKYDVEHIIEIMGLPEDFENEEDEESSEAEMHSKKADRRIYRDPENRVLSGLSAGIGAYFGVDPIVIRVIFVLMTLFYGTSVLIYILLWIIIPEAKTRSQKLEMRGQDINLSSIETSIKKEFNNVKSNFSNWQKSGNFSRLQANFGDILNLFGRILLLLSKGILIIIGVSFLITGIALLGTMTGLFFFNDTFLSPFSWTNVPFSIFDIATLFTDGFNARVGMISSYLLVMIPVLLLIFLGIRFIFRFKTKTKYLGVFAGSLWLVSLILLISSAVKVGFGMRADQEITQNYTIDPGNSDTLYLELFKTQEIDEWNNKREKFDNVYVNYNNGIIELTGKPWITIKKSTTKNIELYISKNSKGADEKEALRLAKSIKYEWQQYDSVIYFGKYFTIEGEKVIRDQNLEAILKIPVGKIIYIGDEMDQITSYIDNIQDFSDYEMTGKYWIMTEDGLSLLGNIMQNNPPEFIEKNQDNTQNNDKIKEEIEEMKSELDSM